MWLPWLLSSYVTVTTTGETNTQSERGPTDGVLPPSVVHLLSVSVSQCVSTGEEHFGYVMMSWEKLTHTHTHTYSGDDKLMRDTHTKLSHAHREQTERPCEDQLVTERERERARSGRPNTAARHAGKSTVREGGREEGSVCLTFLAVSLKPPTLTGGGAQRTRGKNEQDVPPTFLTGRSRCQSSHIPLDNMSTWLELSYWLWCFSESKLTKSVILLINSHLCYWLVIRAVLTSTPVTVAANKYFIIDYIHNYSINLQNVKTSPPAINRPIVSVQGTDHRL